MTEQTIKKRRKGLETTDRILGTAARLFAERGYDGVSTWAIAEGVGVKESSLYNHFKGKEAILDALFDDFARAVPAARKTLSETEALIGVLSPEEILRNTVLNVGYSLNERISDTAGIIYAEMHRNPRASEIYLRVFVEEPTAFYEAVFGRMMDAGVLKRDDARQVAGVFYGAVLSAVTEFALAKGDPMAMKAAVVKMLGPAEFVCRALRVE